VNAGLAPVGKPPERSKAGSAKAGLEPVGKPPELSKVTVLKTPPSPTRKRPMPPKTESVKPPSSPPEEAQVPADSPANPEAKFKAAQTKAKISGVHTLTREDIDGLSAEQIKELRGY
jgi:hypothetical protein